VLTGSEGITDDGVTRKESCRGVVAGGDTIEGTLQSPVNPNSTGELSRHVIQQRRDKDRSEEFETGKRKLLASQVTVHTPRL